MSKSFQSDSATSWCGAASPLVPAIPVTDLRGSGPVEHARRRRNAMLALREACLSVVPAIARPIAPLLDRLSASWLKRTPSPYVDEIAAIAAIADIAGGAGVWFVNASYEWGCTTRVDAAEPFLRRTLDWPFPGLGQRVEVTIQDGGAGVYGNVTWPGAVGVLTAVAPGRFAAAINQAPMYRRTRGWPGLALDFALNAVATFRLSRHWPAAHLLRHVFDTCATFDDAVRVLSTAPIAKPVLFSLSGTQRGEACLIERTQSDAVVWRGTTTIANDWHPSGARWPGHWMARSACPRGTDDSERRRQCLENHVPHEAFDWVRPPVRNAFTRLAVEASAATGALRVIGYEPPHPSATDVERTTAPLDIVVHRDAAPSVVGPAVSEDALHCVPAE